MWLGLTLRNSSTFVKFIEDKPFIGEIELRLASDEEKIEFRRQRSEENKNCDFNYPPIQFTISPSDLMLVQRSHVVTIV